MQTKNAKITGLWGGRGSGKSTRAKELIADINRLIVIDPIGDWGKERGFMSFTNLNSLYRAIKRDWNRGFKFVLITPRGSNPESTLNSLSDGIFLMQEPYKMGRDKRELTLVVEEMALTYPEKTLSKDNRNFLELVNLGRHSGVNIIGISQRMAEVKKGFISNCAEHYFFRMGSHVDYAAVGQIIGRQEVDKLKKLDDHHSLHFSRGVITPKINKFAMKGRQK